MGVFEQFPYANMHEMNLDWLLKKMKELIQAMDTFKATESLKFADPIIWDITTQYEKSTIVLDPTGNSYLSLQAVPAGVQLNNDEYWLEIFNFTDYTRTANKNLTVNVETNTTRATATYQVDDWLIWNDVLYRVTAAIAIDDAFIIAPAAGSNIVHFTVEDFIKAFITYATGLINQYKNDIDASELAYRQQLAQDITNTTASLQAQLNAAIAGATVDSEVINARVGWNNTTYSTLGEAITTQIEKLYEKLGIYRYQGNINVINTDANVDTSLAYWADVSTTERYQIFVYNPIRNIWIQLAGGVIKLQDIHEFIAIMNAEDDVMMARIALGLTDTPIAYNGALGSIINDSSVDVTKVYYVDTTSNPNYLNLMYYSKIYNQWHYSRYIRSDLKNVYPLLGDIIGALPYYGGLTYINADPDVDTSKVYYMAIQGSSNYLKTMYYNGTSWVYGETVLSDYNENIRRIANFTSGLYPTFDLRSNAESVAPSDSTLLVEMNPDLSAYYQHIMVKKNNNWIFGGKVYPDNKVYNKIPIENAIVQRYMHDTLYDSNDYSYTNVLNYATNDLDRPTQYSWIMTLPDTSSYDSLKIYISDTDNFRYWRSITIDDTSCLIENLRPDVITSVKVAGVSDGDETVLFTQAFIGVGQLRMLRIGGCFNVRDIGGFKCTGNKKIKYNKLIRGSYLANITANGKNWLRLFIGVKTEIDLQTDASPDTSIIGPDVTAYHIAGKSYADGFNDTSVAYNIFNRIFTEIEANHCTYIHCYSGCDRTEFYVAMLEGLLGVSESDITKDFELSSFTNITNTNGYRRYRNMGTEYPTRDWAGLIALIKTETGTTFQDKCKSYFTRIGFTNTRLNSIIDIMTE